MSKGPIFIVASSVIILLSFGALCYLMTIVNPKPLKIAPEDSRRYSSVDTLYVNDLFLPGDKIDYGLEKVPEKYLNFINITETPLEKMSYEHGPSGDIERMVVPPVWPRMNFTEIYKNCTRRANESSPFFPIKGHRRSIKDEAEPSNSIKSPTSLILKIVDDDGIQRIEIKMGAKPLNKKARKNRSSSGKTKSKRFNKSKNLNEKTANDKVVLLKANDTITLNIIGDTILLSGANKVETMNVDDGLEEDNATLNSAKYNDDNDTKLSDNFDSNMFSFLRDDLKRSFNINDGVISDSERVSKGIIDIVGNVTLKSIMDEIDVKSNNSAVDLLILEDSLKGALISENDPFALNVNTFNKTDSTLNQY